MRFGLFGSAQARRGVPDVDSGAGFREFVATNVEAEALGYHSTFIVEHHFTGFGQISATLNLLTWVGARTTTLRLGTAVIVLAWHNPVLLAEQAATIDLLSGGRLDFGIGKGYRYNEFAGFATPMEEAEARFDESLAVMLKAWTSETPWSHRGKYWQFDNVVVEPPTAQKPYPPLWMAASSAASIQRVAALGYNLLLDQYLSVEQIRERIAAFKAAVEARGRVFDPMSVGVTRSISIVTSAEDLERAMVNRVAARRRIDRLTVRPDGTAPQRAQLSDAEIKASALYGTLDEVAAMMQILRSAGAEYVLLNSAGGRPTLRRFARELMPAFADTAAIPAGAR
jgi:alkanesulfonate monooxygenase SsuD/methylene tetrahydromethanopterin reductase-like flavin-dependent oxidoreductase (luciferase family)